MRKILRKANKSLTVALIAAMLATSIPEAALVAQAEEVEEIDLLQEPGDNESVDAAAMDSEENITEDRLADDTDSVLEDDTEAVLDDNIEDTPTGDTADLPELELVTEDREYEELLTEEEAIDELGSDESAYYSIKMTCGEYDTATVTKFNIQVEPYKHTIDEYGGSVDSFIESNLSTNSINATYPVHTFMNVLKKSQSEADANRVDILVRPSYVDGYDEGKNGFCVFDIYLYSDNKKIYIPDLSYQTDYIAGGSYDEIEGLNDCCQMELPIELFSKYADENGILNLGIETHSVKYIYGSITENLKNVLAETATTEEGFETCIYSADMDVYEVNYNSDYRKLGNYNPGEYGDSDIVAAVECGHDIRLACELWSSLAYSNQLYVLKLECSTDKVNWKSLDAYAEKQHSNGKNIFRGYTLSGEAIDNLTGEAKSLYIRLDIDIVDVNTITVAWAQETPRYVSSNKSSPSMPEYIEECVHFETESGVYFYANKSGDKSATYTVPTNVPLTLCASFYQGADYKINIMSGLDIIKNGNTTTKTKDDITRTNYCDDGMLWSAKWNCEIGTVNGVDNVIKVKTTQVPYQDVMFSYKGDAPKTYISICSGVNATKNIKNNSWTIASTFDKNIVFRVDFGDVTDVDAVVTSGKKTYSATKGEDGYYYYTVPVATGTLTEINIGTEAKACEEGTFIIDRTLLPSKDVQISVTGAKITNENDVYSLAGSKSVTIEVKTNGKYTSPSFNYDSNTVDYDESSIKLGTSSSTTFSTYCITLPAKTLVGCSVKPNLESSESKIFLHYPIDGLNISVTRDGASLPVNTALGVPFVTAYMGDQIALSATSSDKLKADNFTIVNNYKTDGTGPSGVAPTLNAKSVNNAYKLVLDKASTYYVDFGYASDYQVVVWEDGYPDWVLGGSGFESVDPGSTVYCLGAKGYEVKADSTVALAYKPFTAKVTSGSTVVYESLTGTTGPDGICKANFTVDEKWAGKTLTAEVKINAGTESSPDYITQKYTFKVSAKLTSFKMGGKASGTTFTQPIGVDTRYPITLNSGVNRMLLTWNLEQDGSIVETSSSGVHVDWDTDNFGGVYVYGGVVSVYNGETDSYTYYKPKKTTIKFKYNGVDCGSYIVDFSDEAITKNSPVVSVLGSTDISFDISMALPKGVTYTDNMWFAYRAVAVNTEENLAKISAAGMLTESTWQTTEIEDKNPVKGSIYVKGDSVSSLGLGVAALYNIEVCLVVSEETPTNITVNKALAGTEITPIYSISQKKILEKQSTKDPAYETKLGLTDKKAKVYPGGIDGTAYIVASGKFSKTTSYTVLSGVSITPSDFVDVAVVNDNEIQLTTYDYTPAGTYTITATALGKSNALPVTASMKVKVLSDADYRDCSITMQQSVVYKTSGKAVNLTMKSTILDHQGKNAKAKSIEWMIAEDKDTFVIDPDDATCYKNVCTSDGSGVIDTDYDENINNKYLLNAVKNKGITINPKNGKVTLAKNLILSSDSEKNVFRTVMKITDNAGHVGYVYSYPIRLTSQAATISSLAVLSANTLEDVQTRSGDDENRVTESDKINVTSPVSSDVFFDSTIVALDSYGYIVRTVTFKTSGKSVAVNTSTGAITGFGAAGKTTVTATTTDGGKKSAKLVITTTKEYGTEAGTALTYKTFPVFADAAYSVPTEANEWKAFDTEANQNAVNGWIAKNALSGNGIYMAMAYGTESGGVKTPKRIIAGADSGLASFKLKATGGSLVAMNAYGEDTGIYKLIATKASCSLAYTNTSVNVAANNGTVVLTNSRYSAGTGLKLAGSKLTIMGGQQSLQKPELNAKTVAPGTDKYILAPDTASMYKSVKEYDRYSSFISNTDIGTGIVDGMIAKFIITPKMGATIPAGSYKYLLYAVDGSDNSVASPIAVTINVTKIPAPKFTMDTFVTISKTEQVSYRESEVDKTLYGAVLNRKTVSNILNNTYIFDTSVTNMNTKGQINNFTGTFEVKYIQTNNGILPYLAIKAGVDKDSIKPEDCIGYVTVRYRDMGNVERTESKQIKVVFK